MALTINSSPVLTGESALVFFEEAERYTQKQIPKLSEEREEKLREMDNKSREFMDSLNKKING